MGEIFDALQRAQESTEEAAGPPREEEAPPSAAPTSEVPIDVVQTGGDPLPFEGGAKVELSTELMADWVARAVVSAPASDAASRFRHMAIRMRHVLKEAQGPMLAVSSANAGEGKTTTSCRRRVRRCRSDNWRVPAAMATPARQRSSPRVPPPAAPALH